MKSKLIAILTTGLLSVSSYATEPDTQVIEYYHPLLKHYFVTASASDARFVDAGSAGAGWVRTGLSFGAWSTRNVAPAGASMVYRFYSAGANSHVYVASDADLALLKGLEAKERASIAGTNKRFLGWGLEGEAFLTVLPQGGQCPSGTEAITRTYNQGFTTGEGSNHRFVSDPSLTRSMEDRAWTPEGVVFCAPITTSIAATASASSRDGGTDAVTAGSFSGDVLFELEAKNQPEVKVRTALSLVIAADGTLTGSGGGCTFTGAATQKNGNSKRLRGGSVTATGCTDERFNGTFNRVEIEQLGAKAIDIRFKQRDGAREVEIEGVLTLDTAPPPPDPAALAGDFSGILAVMITQQATGQPETLVLNVNQPVSLTVSPVGAISGSVQGCTIAGTVTPATNGTFTGSVTLAACTEARLNGTFALKAHLQDLAAVAVEVELQREVEAAGVRTKVTISGTVTRTVVPPPAPVSPDPAALAGDYSGTLTVKITQRPAGQPETVVLNVNQPVTLTVSATGAISGTVQGCMIAGTVAPAANSRFTGSVTLTGCTEARLNGTYSVSAHLEDGSAIEVELEREVEQGGVRIKVSIEGDLRRGAPGTPPPVAPGNGIAIAGTFAGNASFEATRRPAGGRETTVVNKTEALTLTVSSTGAVTGTGAGCAFTGTLVGGGGEFSGTITATGCTDAIVNGTFKAKAEREDGNALEVELERESETGGTRVKVKIEGRLSKQ